MSLLDIEYIFIFVFGLFIYKIRPHYFGMYIIACQAFVVPIFFNLFPISYTGDQTHETFYYGFLVPLSSLCIFLYMINFTSRIKKVKARIFFVSFVILVIFLSIQNILKGFNIGYIIANIKDIIYLFAPTLLFCFIKKVRIAKSFFVRFIILFVIIQAAFCILNVFEINLYSDSFERQSFSDNLICGTFARYNHMANYLTTLYLIFSLYYYEESNISTILFVLLSIVIGIIVLFSGARMSVILFLYTIGMCIALYRRKNFFLIFILPLMISLIALDLAKKYDIGVQNADKGTGIERNVSGLVGLFTEDNNDDNTLSLSDVLLLTKFNDPIWGNGLAFRKSQFYDITDNMTESTMKTDARLAYMLVEYGFLGCFCFILLFRGYFITIRKYYSCSNNKMWILIISYYVLFTFTETGIFDIVQLSILSIFAFSEDELDSTTLYSCSK